MCIRWRKCHVTWTLWPGKIFARFGNYYWTERNWTHILLVDSYFIYVQPNSVTKITNSTKFTASLIFTNCFHNYYIFFRNRSFPHCRGDQYIVQCTLCPHILNLIFLSSAVSKETRVAVPLRCVRKDQQQCVYGVFCLGFSKEGIEKKMKRSISVEWRAL